MNSTEQPEDAGRASSEGRSRLSGVRLRTWLIGLVVAAAGAALTNLLTGGISSAFESGWDAVTGSEEPPPLTVKVLTERTRRSAFVFEKRLSELPPRPANMTGNARLAWAKRNGGIDAFTTKVKVVVQGRTDASVILLGLDVDVVSRGRPPTGTLLPPEGAGGIGVRYFEVDLDQRSPEAELGQLNEPIPGQRPINFPYKVSLSDPKVFILYGNTQRSTAGGRRSCAGNPATGEGTSAIRDGDEPFRTASGSAARDEL